MGFPSSTKRSFSMTKLRFCALTRAAQHAQAVASSSAAGLLQASSQQAALVSNQAAAGGRQQGGLLWQSQTRGCKSVQNTYL